MKQPQIRRFSRKTFYYNPEDDDPDNKKIRFERILKSARPEKKSTRRWLIFIIGLSFFFWYVNYYSKTTVIKVESIRIEDVTPADGK